MNVITIIQEKDTILAYFQVYYNKIPTEWLIKVRNSNKFNIYVYHRSQFLD